MKYLLNYSDDEYTLKKFGGCGGAAAFLDQNKLYGLELILCDPIFQRYSCPSGVPWERVFGLHLSFYPSWMNFYLEDKQALIEEFDSLENASSYFGAKDKDEWLAHYRLELQSAQRMGVSYVVFHVSHAALTDGYSYTCSYTDTQILSAFAEIINTITKDLSLSFDILFENHWFSGLHFEEATAAQDFLDSIRAERKGFVLDVGHFMLRRADFGSESQALCALHTFFEQNKSIRDAIKVVHLNSSLAKDAPPKPNICGTYAQKLQANMLYAPTFDRHQPFLDEKISAFLQTLSPEFVVYELSAKTLQELQTLVLAQNAALKR